MWNTPFSLRDSTFQVLNHVCFKIVMMVMIPALPINSYCFEMNLIKSIWDLNIVAWEECKLIVYVVNVLLSHSTSLFSSYWCLDGTKASCKLGTELTHQPGVAHRPNVTAPSIIVFSKEPWNSLAQLVSLQLPLDWLLALEHTHSLPSLSYLPGPAGIWVSDSGRR